MVFSQLHPTFISIWAAGRALLGSLGQLPRALGIDAAGTPPPWPRWSDWVAGPYTSPLSQLNLSSCVPVTTQLISLIHSEMLKLS